MELRKNHFWILKVHSTINSAYDFEPAWRALPSKKILSRRSFNLVHDLSSHARKHNMKRDPIRILSVTQFCLGDYAWGPWRVRRIFIAVFSLLNCQNSSLWDLKWMVMIPWNFSAWRHCQHRLVQRSRYCTIRIMTIMAEPARRNRLW